MCKKMYVGHVRSLVNFWMRNFEALDAHFQKAAHFQALSALIHFETNIETTT